jgi:hypothetical protein
MELINKRFTTKVVVKQSSNFKKRPFPMDFKGAFFLSLNLSHFSKDFRTQKDETL